MMLPKLGSANGDTDDGNSNNSQLLRDIEAISKALYLPRTPEKPFPSKSTVRSKSVEKPRLSESKSSLNPRNIDTSVSYADSKLPSLWNWKKPLKALAHIRHQKFNICFFLHVHSIEGLPPAFDEMNLSVHWKRKDDVLQTRATKVSNGVAEFEEALMYKCSVYGSRSGPHHSAKYEVKLFLICVSVIGAPSIDLGEQWIDLTRLLPVTLEELEGQKSTGKWTTSFKLAGMAKGATLNISLGFSVVRDGLIESRSNMYVPELVNIVHNQSCTNNNSGMLRRVGSVPSNLNSRSHRYSSQSIDVKICDEVSPNFGLELSKSINFLYEKLNEVNSHSSEEIHLLSDHVKPLKLNAGLEFESDKAVSEDDYSSTEFNVVERGIEMSKKNLKLEETDIQSVDDPEIETIDVDEIFKDDDLELGWRTEFHSDDNILEKYVDVGLVDDCKGSSICKTGSSREDLEFAFNSFLTSESAKLELPFTVSEFVEQESYMETKSNYKAGKEMKKSISLDEITESVATDFLNMLEIERSPSFGFSSDGDPESPRERLLIEFKEESMASGNFIVKYDTDGKNEDFGGFALSGSDCEDLSGNFDLSIAIQGTEEDHETASQLLSRRRKAKVLEDLETEALMKKWGLNEEAFHSSPRHCSDGFGSPVELLPEELFELPSLGDGFGHLIQTKDGGYLRSMNPSLFRNSKNVGSLIMQVSRPVVLPSELGSDIIEILQHLASIGIERLSMQANKLMPLENITGKTLQQIAKDAALGAAVPVRQTPLRCTTLFEQGILLDAERGSDHVALESLAPLAMDKIEAMLIEGLKIQSSMFEEVTPSSIGSQPIGKILAFEGKSASLGQIINLERSKESQELDARNCNNDVERLLELSVTLEEWLRLDAGVIGDDCAVEILAAYHAKCIDFITGRLTRDADWENASGRRQGLLGNNLTVALMTLLRDPFRNYEPVGASMLALVQVERSFFHLKPKVYKTVLERSSNEEEDHECKNEDTIGNKLSREEEEKEEDDEYSMGFEITEVHLSGLNAEPGKTQHWGTKIQQQYGTRWLLASGMSKSSRQPSSKSRAIVVSHPSPMRKVQNSDFLWSISTHANVKEWSLKELAGAGFVPRMRNPNVIFPN